MLVASSFSRARAAVKALRAATTRASVAVSSSASCGFETGRRGERVVVQERDFDGREIALENAQLVDAAADRRLLAETRAQGESYERIEHVGRGERQDRARQGVAYVRVAAGAPFK